ncbi:MAG: DUF3168 domain-containing protein [Stutzerimonas stutzeri]|nr:MAG: DUF3168 domain-containing protein [Stutzerimonas stutzeri]
MPIDHSIPLREAVVSALRAAPAVSAIVSARVYGEKPPSTPTWPFVRYGLPIVSQYEATELDGGEHNVTIHAFTKGGSSNAVGALSAAIASALTDEALDLGAIELIDCQWLGSQIIRDTAEAEAWHGIIRFRVITAG